ncbi:MAG: lipocalin family protein [Phycisphaerae bacterium]|nr:lipocalin family protein [Phycisphaerae bacterium]
MRHVAACTLMALVAAMLTGCASIHGTWEVTSIEPTEAKGSFELGRFTLAADGTYTAEVTYAEGLKESNGQYVYDDKTDELTFKLGEGRERTYKAELNTWGNELHLAGTNKAGKAWQAVMKKK